MRIRTQVLAALAALAMASSALPAAAQQQPQQPPGQKFGDWTLHCQGDGDKKFCILQQPGMAQAGGQGNPQRIAMVIASYYGPKIQPALEVSVPLGAILTPGIGLKIDEREPVVAPFVQCLPNGCVAMFGMDDKLMGALKSGKKAQIAFMAPQGQVSFPLSLNGFTAGFAAVPKSVPAAPKK